MRILLTNNTLAERAGSELYVHDVALELLRRGHQPIAFSTVLGEVANLLRAATVPVIDNLDHLAAAPDIIHGHHHFETLTAALHFPDVPVINFCHGWVPYEEAPLIHPRVLEYVAVDDTCRDRLVCTHGIPFKRVRVILNFVDTLRFLPRTRLPEKPRRALAFGHYFTRNGQLEALQEACRGADIEFHAVGQGMNQSVSNAETTLLSYDLVFAKARAALEGMSTGAAVILCGPRGLGSMVTAENWGALRRQNFGVRTLTRPMTAEAVAEQIGRYDPDDAAQVCALVHAQARLCDTVEQLLDLYRKVISAFHTLKLEPGSAEGELATSRYLNQNAAQLKAYRIHHGASESRDHRTAKAFEPFLKNANTQIASEATSVTGWIDFAERQQEFIAINGWMMDRTLKKSCKAIFLTQNDRCLRVEFSNLPRPDISKHYNSRATDFGFAMRVEAEEGPVCVLALSESGELFDVSGLCLPTVHRILRGDRGAS